MKKSYCSKGARVRLSSKFKQISDDLNCSIQDTKYKALDDYLNYFKDYPDALSIENLQVIYQRLLKRIKDSHKKIKVRAVHILYELLNMNFSIFTSIYEKILSDIIPLFCEKNVS